MSAEDGQASEDTDGGQDAQLPGLQLQNIFITDESNYFLRIVNNVFIYNHTDMFTVVHKDIKIIIHLIHGDSKIWINKILTTNACIW